MEDIPILDRLKNNARLETMDYAMQGPAMPMIDIACLEIHR
jgi:hypothetical protein